MTFTAQQAELIARFAAKSYLQPHVGVRKVSQVNEALYRIHLTGIIGGGLKSAYLAIGGGGVFFQYESFTAALSGNEVAVAIDPQPTPYPRKWNIHRGGRIIGKVQAYNAGAAEIHANDIFGGGCTVTAQI